MDHYLDIRLRPDPELTAQHLLNALYARLHRALVQSRSQDTGISFPCHDEKIPALGNVMRLHGTEPTLQTLMASPWLHGMLDHLEISGISTVPTTVQHRQVSRVQAKSSPARLRRRAMRRQGLNVETAAQKIPDSVAERLFLPFVVLGSRSTRQVRFPLFIRHGPLLDHPVPGEFNSYGLSHTASVPWF